MKFKAMLSAVLLGVAASAYAGACRDACMEVYEACQTAGNTDSACWLKFEKCMRDKGCND